MPLNISSFLLPSPGVPFILEDIHIRGSFRVVSTLEERDAISIASRKIGMRVLVADDLIEYELVGGKANANWHTRDYVKADHTHDITVDDVDGLQSALDSKAATEHTHALAIGDIEGLQEQLNNVSPTEHSHGISDINELQEALDSKASIQHDHEIAILDVAGLQDVLTAKANAVHAHSITEVNGLQSALSEKAQSIHNHSVDDIDGLQEALAGKSDTGHDHAIENVLGLQTALNSKANDVHGHAISDITDLAESLDNKADTSHEHGLSDVEGLQEALSAKSNTTHDHDLVSSETPGFMSASDKSKLDDIATEANNYVHPTGDGNRHVPATGTTNNGKVLKAGATAGSETWAFVDFNEITNLPPSFSPEYHSHSVSDVTDLQDILDGKFDKSGGTVEGSLTVTGDLVVQGSSTVINTQELEVEDPIITVAKGNTGVTPYAGVKVERGTSDAFLVFNESTGRWTAYTSSDDLETIGALSSIEADVFYGNLSGNATSSSAATKLATARTISITGDGEATGVFNGTENLILNLSVKDNSHSHAIENVSGLQSALDSKAEDDHNHDNATITTPGFMSASDKQKLDSISEGATEYTHPTGDGNNHVPATGTTNNKKVLKAGATAGSETWGDVSYSELIDVPSSFVPTPHEHTVDNISGLQSALDSKAATLHGHGVSDITGLQNALNSKAPTVHNHAVDDVTGLQTALSEKANVVHGHAISDVTGLQNSLDSKSPTTHSHSDATAAASGFMSAADKIKLNDVASGANNYVHPTGDGYLHVPSNGSANFGKVLRAGATAGALTWHQLTFDDISGVPNEYNPSAHNHPISNVTGLQTELDRKLDKAGGTVDGNLTVTGDLVIQGSSTTIETTNLEIADAVITVAKGNSSASVPYAGIKVERGVSDAFLVFNEATDRWVAYTSSNDLSTAGTLASFQAETFHGNLLGNSSTSTSATKLATSRSISITGDGTATGNFDGTGDLSLELTINDNSHGHTITNVTGLQNALDSKSNTSHVHAAATTSTAGFMSAADKTKLNDIAAGANVYTHPIGDGNLHVPATGTTNNGKVLKAGAIAGSASWANVSYTELSNVPSAFLPSQHSHAISEVSGLQNALNAKLSTDAKAADSDKLDGFNSATTPTPNTVALRDATGNIDVTDITITSDLRKKTVVGHISDTDALEQVLAWESILFTLNDGDGRIMPGFAAQQLQVVTPNLVTEREDGSLGVSYQLAAAYYAAAFRAINARLEKLEQ